MKTTIIIFSLMMFAFLAGCSFTSSGVIQIDKDEFTIAYTGQTGASNTGTMKTAAYKEASNYCKSNNQQLKVLTTEIPPGPYILGKFPQVEVRFTCISE